MSGGHEIVRLKNGGLAVRGKAEGEVMHPGVGPVAEADHLYVKQSRLAQRLGETPIQLTLFDVGLGAGSNASRARAVAEAAPPTAARLQLFSFDKDLGALSLALSEPEAFGFSPESAQAAAQLIEKGQHRTARTLWRLFQGDVLAHLRAGVGAQADIIFWDPYSPRANPALWSVAAFKAARQCASETGTLFTYSASTSTRVALLLAGWAVGVGDSVGEKAETTAAAVRVEDLNRPLNARWLQRFDRSGAALPVDAPDDAPAQVHAAAQFIEELRKI